MTHEFTYSANSEPKEGEKLQSVEMHAASSQVLALAVGMYVYVCLLFYMWKPSLSLSPTHISHFISLCNNHTVNDKLFSAGSDGMVVVWQHAEAHNEVYLTATNAYQHKTVTNTVAHH